MTSEEQNMAKSNKSIEKAIKDFIDEPIGFRKILKLNHLEEVMNKKIIRTNQQDRFIHYGMSDVWSVIWQYDKVWVEDYLAELEKVVNSTNNKAELGMLFNLIPYDSAGESNSLINKLNQIIHTKINT